MRVATALCALVIAAVLTGAAQAQSSFPNRPIRVLVTIPPGGAPDISARLLAQHLNETLGWSVVIENRPGANGNIATEQVAKSAPDGYTLLLHADSGITINPHVYAKLPFDPLKDLLPVTSVATNQFMLSLNPQVPAKTFQEFIEYARNTKPALPYASGGNGSQHQLMMEMLKQRAKIDLLHVPFRGAAPATQATVAGDTKVLFSGSASASLIQSGQLRAVATSGKKRAPRFPDLPTIDEFYPGPKVASDEDWLAFIRESGETVFHPTSTCSMGKVVDGKLRVKGIAGLRVIDASVMPAVPSGNINAAVVAVAEKAADIVKEAA